MACVAAPLRWIAVWTVVFLAGGGSDPRCLSDIFSLKNLPASRCLPQMTRSRCAGGQTSSAMPQGLSENQIWSREPSKTPRHEAVSPLSLPFGRPRNMHGSGPFPQSECKVRKNLRNNNDVGSLFFKILVSGTILGGIAQSTSHVVAQESRPLQARRRCAQLWYILSIHILSAFRCDTVTSFAPKGALLRETG